MKKLDVLVVFAAFLVGTSGTLALGQDAPYTNVPSIAIYNGRTFLAAKLTVGYEFPSIISGAFLTQAVLVLKKGDTLAARGVVDSAGENQGWSVHDYEFVIGDRKVKYPIFGVVNCSKSDQDGNFTVTATTTTFKVDVKAGQVLRSGGYLIKAKRTIKAGEAIPTLLLTGKAQSIMSIESSSIPNGKEDETSAEPVLTICEEDIRPAERDFALKAWRITEGTVRMGFPPIVNLR